MSAWSAACAQQAAAPITTSSQHPGALAARPAHLQAHVAVGIVLRSAALAAAAAAVAGARAGAATAAALLAIQIKVLHAQHGGLGVRGGARGTLQRRVLARALPRAGWRRRRGRGEHRPQPRKVGLPAPRPTCVPPAKSHLHGHNL